MKRFGYVCADPGIPIPGTKGSSIHVESVTRALVRRGFDGEVYSARAKATEIAGLPLHSLGGGVAFPKRPAAAPGSAEARAGTRRRELELLSRNVPIDTMSDLRPDWIYERYSLWHLGGLLTSRRLGVPFVLEVNSPLPEEAARFRELAHPRAAEGVAEALCSNADGIVCVSQEVAAWVETYRGDPEGIWVIPNGVDLERFEAASQPMESPFSNPDPVILFVGSFRPWHGLDRLVEAFDRLRRAGHGANLLLVGDGPMRGELEREFDRRNLRDRVHFTGQVDPPDVPSWGAIADIAVAPYPADDSFYFSPIKVFEFQALGLPVVASRIGQIPELVEHGESGLLVDPQRIEPLVDALVSLIDDAPLRFRLGRAGRSSVEESATWDHRVGELLERIEELT